MSELQIALFAPYVPLPAHSGGRIRITQLTRALRALGAVHLFAQASRSERRAARAHLPSDYTQVHVASAAPALPLPWRSRALPERVRRASPERLRALFLRQHARRAFDLIVVEHCHAAAVAMASGLPWLLDEHNVESEYLRAKLSAAGQLGPRDAAELQKLWTWQAQCWRRATSVAAVSPDDRAQIEAVRGAHVEHVPNGVCSSQLQFIPPQARTGQDVLFVGLMDHPPNVQAAELLARQVMPLVWSAQPDARLVLCGGNPARAVRALAGPRVRVTGAVPSVAPHFASARVFANALQQGAGSSLKVLEALASGIPLVSTRAGVRGFNLLPHTHYLPAQTPGELASAILSCLDAAGSGGDAQARALAGRQLAETHDWQHAARQFAALAQHTAELAR